MRISVSSRSEKAGPETPWRTGAYLAIILVITLCTAGCILIEPEEDTTPVPVNAATASPDITLVQTAAATPVPVVSTVTPVKNITITRPVNLKLYSRLGLPDDVAGSVDAYADPTIAGSITGFLRWDSVRARANRSEASRIEHAVKNIDSAIVASRLDEDLIVYCGITGDVPLRVRSESRYSENGYLSCSFDPSVISHTMAESGRDREGYQSMLVIPERRGSYLLYVNETKREVLLPRAMTWELDAEEKIGRVVFTVESVPRYRDEEMKNVRLLYMTRIT